MNKTRYSIYKLTIHIIFVVKYRRKVFEKDALSLLEKIFAHTCEKLECKLIEFGGERDHVHLLVSLSPKLAIYKLVARRQKAKIGMLLSSWKINSLSVTINADRYFSAYNPQVKMHKFALGITPN